MALKVTEICSPSSSNVLTNLVQLLFQRGRNNSIFYVPSYGGIAYYELLAICRTMAAVMPLI